MATATDGGWAAEVAIPLSLENGWDLHPVDGQIIGLNTTYNDDDNEGERDHKLIWSLNDRDSDRSWNDTLKFGELQF